MPHKKNPDVFELIRARMNRLQSLPQEMILIMNNLPCGYFRDLQELKEAFLPAFDRLIDCLHMTTYIIERIRVNDHILDDERYNAMFSVEEVNRLAAEGMPFRDAYKKVEAVACGRLLAMLPDELRPDYDDVLDCADGEVLELVKAADKLSAYIKCVEELKAGNAEFRRAAEQTRAALDAMHLPELDYFMEHCAESFSMTLDELE